MIKLEGFLTTSHSEHRICHFGNWFCIALIQVDTSLVLARNNCTLKMSPMNFPNNFPSIMTLFQFSNMFEKQEIIYHMQNSCWKWRCSLWIGKVSQSYESGHHVIVQLVASNTLCRVHNFSDVFIQFKLKQFFLLLVLILCKQPKRLMEKPWSFSLNVHPKNSTKPAAFLQLPTS